MKKTLFSLLTVLISATALAQQPTTVLQPSQILIDASCCFFTYDYVYGNCGELTNYYRYKEPEPGFTYTDTVNLLYNNMNNILRCDWYTYDDDISLFWKWERHDYTYDAQNRLVEVFTSDLLNASRPRKRWIPVYDEYDRVVTDSLYVWNYSNKGSESFLYQLRNRTYSETQNVTVRERWYANGPKKYKTTENLTSDGNTESVLWEKYDYNMGKYVNNRLLNYTYSGNRLISVVDDKWDDVEKKWTHDRKTVYTRDDNGHIVLTEHQLWNGIAFSHYKRTSYTRNEAGYPTLMVFEDYSYEDNDWIDGTSLDDVSYYGLEYVNDQDYVDHEIPNFINARMVDSVYTEKHLKFIDELCVMMCEAHTMEFSYIETANPHYYIDDNEDAKVEIYPNPAKNVIKVSGQDLSSVSVTDIMGRQVLESACEGDNADIDISSLNPGIYLIRVKMDDGSGHTERIVIE